MTDIFKAQKSDIPKANQEQMIYWGAFPKIKEEIEEEQLDQSKEV